MVQIVNKHTVKRHLISTGYFNTKTVFMHRAGWIVHALDTSDPDWWKGRYNTKIGYFPAKYAEKLNPGERVLQVSQGLEVTEAEGSLKLLKDQVMSTWN